MSTYVPGFWSQQYQNLSNTLRTQINKKVDEAFRQKTGISRPLDPKTDRDFNAFTGSMPGRLFQMATNRSAGQAAASWVSSF